MAEEPSSDRQLHDVELVGHGTSSGSEEADSVGAKKALPACKLRRNYYCKACAFCTVNPREYLYHLRDEHGERLQIYECSACVYASRGKVKLVRHLRMVHGICQSPFANTAASAGVKITAASAASKPAANEEKLTCPKQNNCKPSVGLDEDNADSSEVNCEDDEENSNPDFGENEEIEDENVSETEDIAYSEELLDSEHASDEKFVKTLQADHHDGLKKKFYRCSKCDYTTNIRSRFSKHVRYHSMPMIKCELCEFQTPYKWNLDRHMKNHNSDGVYKCNVCTFSSQIKQSLTVHIQNHHLPHENAGIEFTGGFVDLIPTGIEHDYRDECVFGENNSSNAARKHLSDSSGEEDCSPKPSLALDNIDVSGTLMELDGDLRKPFQKPPESVLSQMPLMGSSEGCGDSDKLNMEQIAEKAAKAFLSADSDSKEPLSVLDQLFNKKLLASISPGKQNFSGEGGSASSTPVVKHPIAPRTSSTRCQYCRHRCKSTDDLRVHLSKCQSALTAKKDEHPNVSLPDHGVIDSTNELNDEPADADGIEILDEYKSQRSLSTNDAPATVRKLVYKCNQCSFWAVTGSRFHMHIAGHMNAKPYRCSVCQYRSNWRWDITKHIKQRASKDSSHHSAQLVEKELDNKGRYEQYDGFICEMEVEDGLQCKSNEGMTKESRSPPASPSFSDRPKFSTPNVTITPHNGPVDLKQQTSPATTFPDDLPLPPPLTRAPQRAAVVEPAQQHERSLTSAALTTTNLETLKMDPILAAMDLTVNNTAIVMPEPAPDLSSIRDDSAVKDVKSGKKATVWRCKKCNFKHADRDVVRIHYRGHLCGLDGAVSDVLYVCAHCGHASLWRHVIERHCRFKHDGIVSIVEQPRCSLPLSSSLSVQSVGSGGVAATNAFPPASSTCVDIRPAGVGVPSMASCGMPPLLGSDVSISVVSRGGDHSCQDSGALFRCDICSYVCANTDAQISAHMHHHTPQPGALYKCMICPYYVSSQAELLEHVSLHGMCQKGAAASQYQRAGCLDLADVSKGLPSGFYRVSSPQRQSDAHAFVCDQCPFSTNQQLLFAAHQQLHAPSDDRPLRCPCCSFSAQRPPQLAQHVRLHGVCMYDERLTEDDDDQDQENGRGSSIGGTTGQAVPSIGQGGNYEYQHAPSRLPPPPLLLARTGQRDAVTASSTVFLDDVATRNLAEIPLVWVSRAGKFYKMFKCRQCPHVNLRKSNIQEHERMHTDRDVVGFAHRCSLCNYVCVNAGVLSSHVKVHANTLGTVHALVDPALSDELQLRAIIGDDQLLAASDSLTAAAARGDDGLSPIKNEYKPISLVTGRRSPSPANGTGEQDERLLYFCQDCPARFFHQREIDIHARFHGLSLPFACNQCSYTSRQQQHLMSHAKVHSAEYGQRSRSLLALYGVSRQHPPSTQLILAAVTAAGDTGELRVPMATSQCQPSFVSSARPRAHRRVHGAAPRASPKRHWCKLCPARFVKEATLRYHVSLHGCSAPFRCNKCNYAVKTYGNLTQHINLHIEAESAAAAAAAADDPSSSTKTDGAHGQTSNEFPMSGLELFKRKLDFQNECREPQQQRTVREDCRPPARKVARSGNPPPLVTLKPGDPFYMERAGNPDFVYPTVTDRYGREREKRYKCRKCPSAFEKREQYLKHISLHGVSGRFTCTHCDYAVNYYPNFCNHMKRHGVPPLPMSEASNRVVHPVESADTATKTSSDDAGTIDTDAMEWQNETKCEEDIGADVPTENIDRSEEADNHTDDLADPTGPARSAEIVVPCS